jgi:hypothetical protein
MDPVASSPAAIIASDAVWSPALQPRAVDGGSVACHELRLPGLAPVPCFTGEYWTARQREGHSLHEISYRACFKPSLPAYFLERLTRPGDRVLDPFMGRGTTVLEAALRGRIPCGNDINPLSRMLVEPRLMPPSVSAVEQRLAELDLQWSAPLDEDLLVFYHPATLRQICALRAYLLRRAAAGVLDGVDAWIRMVTVNRLTGHSAGFLSVYTLPPNQAISAAAQRKINAQRQQAPPERDLRRIVAKKTRQLLQDQLTLWHLQPAAPNEPARLGSGPAAAMPFLPDASIQLVITSPPFLDVVQYAADNWLRCWFCGIDASQVPITMARTVPAWQAAMAPVFAELLRVVRPGGHVAFEVGEVKRGRVRLEEVVIPVAAATGFVPELVMIHTQQFTKTANCWGVGNNTKGTNTNRIVVLRRP